MTNIKTTEGIFEELSNEQLSQIWGGLLLDGTFNNPDVLSHIDALNTNLNSDRNSGENKNANTRVSGKNNNSILDVDFSL